MVISGSSQFNGSGFIVETKSSLDRRTKFNSSQHSRVELLATAATSSSDNLEVSFSSNGDTSVGNSYGIECNGLQTGYLDESSTKLNIKRQQQIGEHSTHLSSQYSDNNQHQFINSDGSIYSLVNSNNGSGNRLHHNRHHQNSSHRVNHLSGQTHQHSNTFLDCDPVMQFQSVNGVNPEHTNGKASLKTRRDSTDQKVIDCSGGSGSKSNSSKTGIVGRNSEQHRRLQYQVHQKLQKIYGNRLQEFEHHNQIQLNRQRSSRTVKGSNGSQLLRAPASNHHQINMMKVQSNQSAQQQYRQEKIHGGQTACLNMSRNNDGNQHISYSLMNQHSQIDKNSAKQATDLVQEQDFYDVRASSKPSCHHHHQPQQYSDQHSVIREKELLYNTDQYDIEQNNEEDDDDKEDLCLVVSDTSKKVSASSLLDRKRQLESLQYATATAVALLNVTANAAAAFAATEKHLSKNQFSQQKKLIDAKNSHRPPLTKIVAQQSDRKSNRDANRANNLGTIYSETTYQDIGLGQHQQQRPRGNTDREARQIITTNYTDCERQYRQLQRNQQLQQSKKQATILSNQQVIQAMSHLDRSVQNKKLQPPMQMHYKPAFVSSDLLEAGQYQSAYNLQQHYEAAVYQPPMGPGPQLALIRPPPQGRPPTVTSLQQLDALRRQHHQALYHRQQIHQGVMQNNQQHQALRAGMVQHNQVPKTLALQTNGCNLPATIAILHHGSTGAPLDFSMANRFSVNQQRIDHSALQQQRLAVTGIQNTNSAINHLSQAAAIYGMMESNGTKQQQPLYGPQNTSMPIRAIQTSAPSDASGHSSMPLILDRQLAKSSPSLIEKICRIDLTLFWWSLLVICVLFIMAVITINRHV